jgi:hypothetical protein
MRKLMYVLLLAAAISIFGFSSFVFAENGNGPSAAAPGAVTHAAATRGQVMCTAAINADGTVASCFNCSKDVTKTKRQGTGTYQVTFNNTCPTVAANSGWSRWVQPDTLSTSGSVGARFCTTSDLGTSANGVFVDCYDSTGTNTDTSFFLFVAR